MKLYDISQEILSCKVFPGDPAPEAHFVRTIADSERCNLTAFSMCAHNGTHVDAPYHFLEDGKKLDELGLEPFVGWCAVVYHAGGVTAQAAEEMIARARALGGGERILISGPATVMPGGAVVFAKAGLLLLGNESQTFGPEGSTMEIHRTLLGAGMVLLEGVVLTDVPEGRYLLSAAPLNLAGHEGAPCRAFLIDVGQELT